jgi:hypothetical protein
MARQAAISSGAPGSPAQQVRRNESQIQEHSVMRQLLGQYAALGRRH